MKIAGLIIGILITLGAGIGSIIGLALPAMTNNRVNFGESMVVLIPSILILCLGLLITLIFAVLLLTGKKTAK